LFSVIVVYNNKEILNGWLLESLNRQSAEFEYLAIDNTEERFASAAEALNYEGKRAKADYIMFVHQDVKLIGDDWLCQAERYLESIDDLGIAGVAGMSAVGRSNGERGRNVIFHGQSMKRWGLANKIDKPVEVQTLDEQLLIVHRGVFDKLKFDQVCCPGWHLYGVAYSLDVRRMNLKAYVIPLEVWHKSMGSRPLSRAYFRCVRKLFLKHGELQRIYTTCGEWPRNSYHLYWLEGVERLSTSRRAVGVAKRLARKAMKAIGAYR